VGRKVELWKKGFVEKMSFEPGLEGGVMDGDRDSGDKEMTN